MPECPALRAGVACYPSLRSQPGVHGPACLGLRTCEWSGVTHVRGGGWRGGKLLDLSAHSLLNCKEWMLVLRHASRVVLD